jgi:hypothetical protein
MSPRSRLTSLARVARIRIWILVLTLLPALGALFFSRSHTAAGLAAGGFIVFLNLLGTQSAVTQMVEGQGIQSIIAIMVWFGKFGITAAVILGILYSGMVDPIALLVGLGSLPVSLIFDIFLFPVNKGEAKNTLRES